MTRILFYLTNNVDLFIPFKMALSTLFGALVGMEREKNRKPGGGRTFALACLGSALIGIFNLELLRLSGFDLHITRLDIARLPSYAIAGIGFLGSGIIIQNRNRVEGITTASTLWSIVSVGLLVGHGYYFIAGLATVFIYLILASKDKHGNEEYSHEQRKKGRGY